MNIILNPSAAGGRSEKKWKSIKDFIFKKFSDVKVFYTNKNGSIENIILSSIKTGDYKYIIAGGDGTVNYFVNKMMEVLNENEVKNIKIGVVGIGSSNDFCKPFNPESFINKIPCKINFDNTELRDVGCISYKDDEKMKAKYFLLNASLGVTAEANYLFNNPDFILKSLKKHFTKPAILYAAAKTIFTHENFDAKITFSFKEAYLFSISNLSIIKSPHFSGDLSYSKDANYQNGLFNIYLTHSMDKFDLINLLLSLNRKIFPKNEKTKQGNASWLRITSQKVFPIEFDGEIIKTNYAEFSVLNKYLNICVN